MKNSKKKQPASLTQVRGLLKEVVWNPRTKGPMSIISDVGGSEYYECRAIEEIREAQSIRKHISTDPCGGDGFRTGNYHASINKAIRLLLLARLSVNGPA